jgi:hypothetical protein
MLALAIAFAFIGALLGLKFKVLVLVPTIVIAMTAIMSISIARGTGLALPMIGTVFAVIAVQVGYLIGAALRLILAAARDARVQHLAHPPRAVPLRPTR